MRIFGYKRLWTILLLPAGYMLILLAAANPYGTEHTYSRRIYPVLAGIFGRIFSAVTFSVAEWLMIVGLIGLAAYIAVKIIRAVRNAEKRRDLIAQIAATLCCIAGIGYFIFVLLCAINYHRLSFAQNAGLTVRPSSSQELGDMCQEFAERLNALRTIVLEDKDGVMRSGFETPLTMSIAVQQSFNNVSNYTEAFAVDYTICPKPILFSKIMSYLDITGVYIPFTFEPNINIDIPDLWQPCTMMHELAHFKGFMREEEANFIAYLACNSSSNEAFEYSGTMLAFIHSTNALYTADKDRYWELMDVLSDGVKRDLNANNEYWQQFEGPVADVSSAVNDVYLKSNRQQSGVKSYGEMVDLLLADYRMRHEIS